MSSVIQPEPCSFEQWLQFEESATLRHELIGGHLVAMGGGTDLHNLIALGLRDAIRQRLAGRPCRVYVADVKLKVAEEGYYPDLMLTCSQDDSHRLYKTEPLLLAEVLSDTSIHRDRVTKLRAYRRLPSLKAYLILSQESPRVEAHVPTDQGWQRREYGLEETVMLTGAGLELPVRKIYGEVLGELGYLEK